MNAMKNELDDDDDDDDDEQLEDEQEEDEQEEDELDDEQEEDELDEHVVVAGTPVMLAEVTLTAGRFSNADTIFERRSEIPAEDNVGLLPTSASLLTSNAVTPVLEAGLNT